MKFFFQVVIDPRYQIIKTAEMQTSADELPEEKQVVELVAKIEKPNLTSEDNISKRFDVVTDCSDHHFVKESGHESVMHLLKLSLAFCFNFQAIVIRAYREVCVMMFIFYSLRLQEVG